jgi:hypothetical protein
MNFGFIFTPTVLNIVFSGKFSLLLVGMILRPHSSFSLFFLGSDNFFKIWIWTVGKHHAVLLIGLFAVTLHFLEHISKNMVWLLINPVRPSVRLPARLPVCPSVHLYLIFSPSFNIRSTNSKRRQSPGALGLSSD